jgi:molybdopterin biosynthesis enzyme MoaB
MEQRDVLVGILTISDTVSIGVSEDKSGPQIQDLLQQQQAELHLKFNFTTHTIPGNLMLHESYVVQTSSTCR